MDKKKTIFVTGITGNQGGAVVKHLLSQHHKVIGLTRNTNSKKAEQWKKKGVKVVAGNLDDTPSFKHHLDHVDGVFFVQGLQAKRKEIQQGKQFIDGINDRVHLVYASVLGADLNTRVPHFESKFELENYIKSKNKNYTILRPASFFENHLFPRVANDIKKGKYISPLNKLSKQQMIGVDDIGKIAAQILSKNEDYKSKVISIATDEWQISDIPNVFSEVLDKPVKYKKLPGFITRLAMGKDLSKMFKYMNEHDFTVIDDIEAVKREFGITGTFKNWVYENFKP